MTSQLFPVHACMGCVPKLYLCCNVMYFNVVFVCHNVTSFTLWFVFLPSRAIISSISHSEVTCLSLPLPLFLSPSLSLSLLFYQCVDSVFIVLLNRLNALCIFSVTDNSQAVARSCKASYIPVSLVTWKIHY